MKYELKETNEKYVRVYPRNENPTTKELEVLEEYLIDHVPYDIGDVFDTVDGYMYKYVENNNIYKAYSLEELCNDVALSRGTLNVNNKYNWIIRFSINNENYTRQVWEFDDLLHSVSRFNCEIIGYLSDSQKALVDVARDLYDGVDEP